MRRLRALALRVLGLCGLGRSDRDIDQELATHLHLIEAEYRRAGMTEADARRAATAEFGPVALVTEAYRDRRGLPSVESLLRDLRHAARSLRRSPVLALSMVVVLALGIGLSTAVVAAFDSVVWRGLPVPEPGRVVKVALDFQGVLSREVRGSLHWFSYPEFSEFRAAARTVESLAGVSQVGVTWRAEAGSRRVSAALVTGDYFRVVRVVPAVGRVLAASDSQRPVVVISHRLWVEAFGAAPSVLTQSMVIDRASYTVVGVANEAFLGTDMSPVDLWLPLEGASAFRGESSALLDRNVSWLQVIGRLAPGTTPTEAAAESAVITARFDLGFPGRRTTVSVTRASRLDAALFQSRDRGRLIGVGAVAALLVITLLLICGSNVAALLLARGATRQREIALRLALGAGRGHIAQALVAEVLVIVGAGAALGVAVYSWALRALAMAMPPPVRDVFTTPTVDVRVLAFVAIAAGGIALFFGLAPLRQSLRVDCLAGLKGIASMRGSTMPAARVRQRLASVQVALSVLLLITAALLGRGLARASHLDPGYVTKDLFVVRPDVAPGEGPASAARRWQLMSQARDTIAAAPGVLAASLTTIPPFSGTGVSSARTDQMPAAVPVHFNTVGHDYFQTLGIQPVAGRLFLPREPDVVLVNARMARTFWGDERAAINRTLHLPGRTASDAARLVTVVGVVPTIQTTDVGLPDEASYYLSIQADYLFAQAVLVVRTSDGLSFPRLVSKALRTPGNETGATVVSIDDRIATSTGPARVITTIAGFVGILALLVAAVGVHGIIAHGVISRTRDIGVYVALGAPHTRVLRLVLGQTLGGVAIGALAGGALAVGLGVVFADQAAPLLFGMVPTDPVAALIVLGILLAFVLMAAYLPARRALNIQPSEALRRDT